MNLTRKTISLALLAALALTSACKQGNQPTTADNQQPKEVKCEYVDDGTPSMRKAFKDKFLIGAAVNTRQVASTDPKVINAIRNNFSALVPENCMKPEEIHPKKDLYDWGDADALVELAQRNGQVLTGHCLIWHSQVPYWFFKDDMAQPVTREELINRMKEHITTVVQHFKGKIKGWDVVNEAVMEDGSLRKSPFLNIIGPDFIKLAFQFAHEADPNVELYYNDYGMDNPAKREGVIKLVRELKAAGCRVDGIGMQSHVSFNTNLDEYEKSIVAYAAEGVKVMVTELDLSVLPWPKGNYGAAVETNFEYMKEMNPYTDGLPAEKAQEQTDFFVKLFGIYLKHADIIDRVTFWGVTDGDSWKNGWPMPGRTDYPLAIDRNYQPKPFVDAIIKLAEESK
ncbi:MAG: endo-1,4-beta-xylanase [Bacteroidales bacterium]|nr:endo-1,4-beta-xylanase [Bacteroidales bacterium]